MTKPSDYLDYLQNADKVPQTETRSYLVQTWRGYEYRTKTKHFKGPAPTGLDHRSRKRSSPQESQIGMLSSARTTASKAAPMPNS